MLVNKRNILSAIAQLVRGYNNNTLKHTSDHCPLCKLYCPCLGECSTNCPNNVFSFGEHDNTQCVSRICRIKNLNWNNRYNELSAFWQEVYDMLKGEKPKDVIELSEGVREKILAIAENYKTDDEK